MIAQAFNMRGWSIGELAIAIVVIAAIFALVFIALKAFGVTPPPWATQVMWVVIIAFVVIVAIRLVMGM